MRRASILVSSLLASAHFVAEVACAQVVIRGDPTCQTCTIERSLVVRIGDAGDGSISPPVVVPVVRDSRGRFFVKDQDKGSVKVFSPDGKFTSLLGRDDVVPGESVRPGTVAIGVGDSIFVIDRSLARASVFGPDLRFVRSFPLPPFLISVHSQVVGDRLIVNAQVADPKGSFPLFVFTTAGRRVKAIGPAESVMDESQAERSDRVMGRAGNGTGKVLVARRHGYQWWRLSDDLDPEAEFSREASWFRPYEPPNTQPFQMNGVSYVKAIWEDEAGLTWVGLGTIHIRAIGDGKRERTESSRVELLDGKSGTVLASVEFPETLVSGFSDGTVVFSEVRDDGRTMLSVLRLSLRR